jgi:hypothetical protein
MLNGDGTELRQRNVPAAEERPNLEESILRRREKMRQEDREPASLMVFAVVIGIFCFLCWAGWYFILRFDDHWIIQEIEHGHVNAVRMFLAEHHELALIDKLDAVRGATGAEPSAPVPRAVRLALIFLSCLVLSARTCPHH